MKKMILLAASLLVLAGCTKTADPINQVVCAVQDKIVSVSSDAIVAKLVCSHPEAIKADVLAIVEKSNLCKPADGNLKGPVGNFVCPALVDSLIGLGKSKIPETWGCTAGTLPEDIKDILLPLCQNNI